MILFTSCLEKNKSNFQLNGVIDNIPNETSVYLAINGVVKDSTVIKDKKFTFKGSLQEPTEYDLFVKTTNDYTSIWLENNQISFTAKKGNFSNAEIEGSISQREYTEFRNEFNAYRDKIDSLYNIIYDKKNPDSVKLIAKNEFKANYSDRRKIDKKFIKNNPNSYVSIYLLKFYRTTFGKELTEELFNYIDDDLKHSSYGKAIKRFLSLSKNINVGDNYVDFSMKNANDQNINLSDFKGKIVLLQFWSTSCGGCRSEYPFLRKAYDTYKDKGFEIVGISNDRNRDYWLKAIKDEKLNWTNLWELNTDESDAALIYSISYMPTNFLIDQNGTIIAKDLREDKLLEKLEELF